MTHRKNKPSDEVYRSLFSNWEMIRDLIDTFLGNDFSSQLDETTLVKMDANYIGNALQKRSGDLVWKIKWRERDEWLYLLTILEFQSKPYHFMIVRVLSYTALLYESLIKQDQSIKRYQILPPVIPIVWYSSEKAWMAPVSMAELRPRGLPEILRKYQPDMTFFLVNEGCYNPNGADNFVKLLVRAAQSQSYDEVLLIYRELDARLSGEAHKELREASLKFAHYINGYKNLDKLTAAQTLAEVATTMRTLPEKIRDQGIALGLSQGLSQGMIDILLLQLNKKFGSLTKRHRDVLKTMTSAELEEIGLRIFDAEHIDELIHFEKD